MRLYTLLKTYLTTVKPIKYGGTGCSNATDIVQSWQAGLVDLLYPVGSIYTSVSSNSPESLFGGSWEQLENRFLLGAGTTYTTVGATGGSDTHSLDITEIPSHTHTFTGSSSTLISAGSHSHSLRLRYTESSSGTGLERISGLKSYRTRSGSVLSAGAHTHTATAEGTNETVGGGNPHNNMPPYLVVYMWKRIG